MPKIVNTMLLTHSEGWLLRLKKIVFKPGLDGLSFLIMIEMGHTAGKINNVIKQMTSLCKHVIFYK